MIKVNEHKTNNSPRFLMVLSVPLILFLILLLGYNSFIPLKVEIHSIIIIFFILVIFISFITHNAWYSFAQYKNTIYDVIEEVDTYLNQNQLVLAGKKKALANIEPFFQRHFEEIRNDNFASIATSIFPTLGILGTFLAIAISMPDFTVESKEALESEITVLLSGVGTAFYASIYGIFLSIWWVFFEKRGLTKIENEMNEIKLQYKELIWEKEEIELYKILEAQDQNQKFIEKIENVVTPEYITKLDKIAQEKIDKINALDDEYKVSEQRLTKNLASLGKVFELTSVKQNELLESFEKIENSLNKSSEVFDKSVNEQKSNSKALNNEIYSVLSSFELVSRDLKTLGKELIDAK